MFFDDGYFREETREGFVIAEDMKRAWAAQLEVLEEVKRVCGILGIKFFADWGTLLGAVRHHGFIPWDDDMDIAMLRKDYMRFLSEAPVLLEKYYEIKSVYNDPEDDTIKARIINGRHICFEPDFLAKFHGCPYVVGIDIFPVDNITDDKRALDKQIESLRFLLRTAESVPEKGPYGAEVLELMKKIEKTFGIPVNYNNRLKHELKKIYDVVCSLYHDENSAEVCSMIDFAEGWDYHAKKEWYEDICELSFENTTIPVLEGYDGLLQIKYGEDYMTPRNVGSSHDYPFYKSQIEELRLVMQQEFNTEFTTEEVIRLIHAKIKEAECKMVNVGIIGTGRIASRFLEESRYVSGINVSAIYNPHLESVLWFAKNNNINIDGPVILTDDSEAFFDAVDAVYIAAPHEMHTEYIRIALEKGKHVLCEKPMGLNKSDIQQMLSVADDKKLVCMEAIKTAYCAGFERILDIVKSGAIGKVRDVEAAFSKISVTAGREMWGASGGSFTELASYCLLPVIKLLGTEVKDVHTYSVESPIGTDSYTKMMITYDDGVATIKTGLGVKTEGELIVAGDDGYIRVPSPWWLTKRIEVHHENPNQVEVYEEEFAGGGLRYEIEAFVQCINNPGTVKKITDEESIWLSGMMEQFLANRGEVKQTVDTEALKRVGIWAHRGCSMMNPENTLLAFKKAAELEGITGIEFDVQLTKDNEIVVIHDERVDRTTDGTGYVQEYTLNELKQLFIAGDDEIHRIPTLRETFELLAPYCKGKGLHLNIELKNSEIRYEGMEQRVIDMVSEFNLEDYVVYSSFNHDSIGLIKQIKADAEVAYLAGDYHRCMDGIGKYGGMTIHPAQWGMPINKGDVENIRNAGFCVRMWNGSEPLYGQLRTLPDMDLREYYRLGATDIFTNVPERYCENRR